MLLLNFNNILPVWLCQKEPLQLGERYFIWDQKETLLKRQTVIYLWSCIHFSRKRGGEERCLEKYSNIHINWNVPIDLLI